MKSGLVAAGPLVLATFVITACGGSDAPWVRDEVSESGNVVVHAESDPAVPRVGDNTVFLSLSDPDGVAITGASIEVEPWMPHHGHGTEAVPVAEELGDGDYKVGNVVYTMSGMWELRTEVQAPDVEEHIVLHVDVP